MRFKKRRLVGAFVFLAITILTIVAFAVRQRTRINVEVKDREKRDVLKESIAPLKDGEYFLSNRFSHVDQSIEEEINKTVPTDPYVVPNIVHFIWFAPDNLRYLSFLNYVSILSAHRIHRPQLMLLHCNNVPAGKWWKRLWRRVPLKIVNRKPPMEIFGQKIGSVYHSGDVVKLELILKYGGIYLDMDVIVVNSLDPLRVYEATMGKERGPKLIAGIMIGARGAEFYRVVYESYRGNYRKDDWDFNCARRPYEIYESRRELLHVEQYKLTTPDFEERHLLMSDVIDWRDLYVIHVMAHLLPPDSFRPDNMRTSQTTLGEVIRYIYYGSPDVRPW